MPNPTEGNPFSVHLIRHAESENNARPIYERVCDPRITPRGQLQTKHLADWMETLELDRVITSPFQRTLQTTKGILEARGRSTEVWHDIFESGGCFHGYQESNFEGAPGYNLDQISAFLSSIETAASEASAIQTSALGQTKHKAPDASPIIDPEIGSEGWWASRPRESQPETKARAARVSERLAKTFAGSGLKIALVIHADFERELLRVMLRDVLKLDIVGPIANTSVTELQFNGTADNGHWKLGYLNSVTHLPPRLITGREW